MWGKASMVPCRLNHNEQEGSSPVTYRYPFDDPETAGFFGGYSRRPQPLTAAAMSRMDFAIRNAE